MTPGVEELGIPAGASLDEDGWTLLAASHSVNKAWERLIERAPENAIRCFEYLQHHPTLRYPGRVFPLRGKKYRGAWEYEVTGSDRLYYVPDPASRTVTVFYVGEHPNRAPAP